MRIPVDRLGGRVGQAVGPNKNGTYDLGPMQINEVWMSELAGQWGVSKDTARKWVKDDPCTNVGVSAWILRTHLDETRDLSRAIAHYHSRTPHLGGAYKHKVIASIHWQAVRLWLRGARYHPHPPAGQGEPDLRAAGRAG